ncbi:N-acetylmuramoyl-L-alanine amidase [Sphingomonas sp.]|uniref:N-acetylmuramoyl-L-alanine amidase family protein n=1 Tax=Sphingomonas sp. TaxID=28214 RepID=UPI0025E34133|nr:N-acetylmuramoyl-L-alanine amidase [Sphingomonas sp.]
MITRTVAAGAAIAGAVTVAALLLAGAGRTGATPDRNRAVAAVGEARTGRLTMVLPAAVSDRIYAAPSAVGRPIVVIDAGHGGQDPGATSVSGQVHEKDLTLALARELRDTLVERGRVRVAMTRDDDRYLTLDERAAVAQRLDASTFVSLHMDSAPNPLARGATIYSLSDVASDAEAARAAAADNRGGSDEAGGGSVAAMLSDLAMRDQMNASAEFATRVAGKSAGRFELRPEPHRFADFHVLRRAAAPAILFEAGYISNADDELLLRDPEHRKAIVLALAQAIEADVATRSRIES